VPDDASTGRALVTANIKDFIPLDTRYRAASQSHAGLILVSAKTFPQDRSYTAAVTSALSALLDQSAPLQPGQVTFPTPAISIPTAWWPPKDQALTTCHGR
jgi:hypothetical protein